MTAGSFRTNISDSFRRTYPGQEYIPASEADNWKLLDNTKV